MSSVQGASSAANAIQQWQYLQSLSTASAGASQPKKAGSASAFDPFAGLGGTTQAPTSSGPVPPFNLDSMSALINAQAQSSGTGTNGLSRHQQKVFGQLDTDGDGKVTGAELQKDFGADNKAIADFVMKKLDADGDGAISQSEFAAGTTRGGGHHHMHAGAPQGQDALAALLGATQGASSTSTGNSDGSSTTTITYADGSKVSMTSAASANSDNSSNANSSAKSNLLEQLIKLQAQLTQGAAASSSVATV
jgi:hypothetical protein